MCLFTYRVFSRDITAAMLVSPTNPLGIELCSSLFLLFCFKNMLIDHVSENALFESLRYDNGDGNLTNLHI